MDSHISAEEMQRILDEFVAQGIAWKGEDGRYRIREDVKVTRLPDGTAIVERKPTQ